jgi:hypothetical protein
MKYSCRIFQIFIAKFFKKSQNATNVMGSVSPRATRSFVFLIQVIIGGRVAQSASSLKNAECQVGRHLLIGYLLCVIKFSHIFSLTFFKPCAVVRGTLKMCMWLFGSVWTFFWKIYMCLKLVTFQACFE